MGEGVWGTRADGCRSEEAAGAAGDCKLSRYSTRGPDGQRSRLELDLAFVLRMARSLSAPYSWNPNICTPKGKLKHDDDEDKRRETAYEQ